MTAELVGKVLRARTVAEIDALRDDLASTGVSATRPVGGRDNNAGTIEIASNPYSAISERVTNGMDAILERHAQLQGLGDLDRWQTRPTGPRDAAQTLLKLPRGGVGDLTIEERQKLAEDLVVMLEESGDPARPTIIVEDRGIGQRPDEMPHGLLSLNESNKMRKPWQHGAYGQGGSATLRFAIRTLIMSRKDPALLAEGETDAVGWTIVYKDEGDPYKEALAVYRYVVDSEQQVPSFDPNLLEDPDWYGTRIVHAAYDLSKYLASFTQLTNGAWGMLHSQLFDPVIPFRVGGRRQRDLDAMSRGAKGAKAPKAAAVMQPVVLTPNHTRTVQGNKARLDQGPKSVDSEVAWKSSSVVDLSASESRDLGRFVVNYWVVRRPPESTSTREAADAYVSANSAVTVTLNGQRHDTERRSWLKDNLRFPYLAKNLIVQIDIDGLTPPAKRELFSATREQMVEGPMKKLIYDETVNVLANDPQLRVLEDEQRERAMSKGAAEVGDRVRERLQKFINSVLDGQTRDADIPTRKEEGDGPPPHKPDEKPPTPPRDTDDRHLPSAPTKIRFERNPIRIVQGGRTTVWVHVDAKNDYLQRHEDDLAVEFSPDLGGKVADVRKSQLLAGKSMWTLQADESATPGDGTITASLVTPNGLISATAAVTVVAPPKKSKRKRRKNKEPKRGPNIQWVHRPDWSEHQYTENTVGSVNISDKHTDILVNRHHRMIDKALRARKLSKEQVDSRSERYLFAIACGLFRQEWAARNGSRPDTDQWNGEQGRMAEVVLLAMNETDIE